MGSPRTQTARGLRLPSALQTVPVLAPRFKPSPRQRVRLLSRSPSVSLASQKLSEFLSPEHNGRTALAFWRRRQMRPPLTARPPGGSLLETAAYQPTGSTSHQNKFCTAKETRHVLRTRIRHCTAVTTRKC